MKKTSAAKQSQVAKELRVNEQKWSKTLMDAGWTAFPSVIIERQKALGLDAMDLNILLHLASHGGPEKQAASVKEDHRCGNGCDSEDGPTANSHDAKGWVNPS